MNISSIESFVVFRDSSAGPDNVEYSCSLNSCGCGEYVVSRDSDAWDTDKDLDGF